MSSRTSRTRTVLVMWEHRCEHSPLWSRSGDLPIGNLDARDLGLPEDLREDLADWNRRCEGAADPSGSLPAPTSSAEWRRSMTEAFPLAARVQRGLGAEWTVWCLAGGGDGGLHDAYAAELRSSGAAPVVLRTGGPVEWSPDRVIVTDTLPLPPEKRFPGLEVLPIAPLLARAIHEVFEDGSVTSMFNGAA